MSELTALRGVRQGRARALAGAGVESLADVAGLEGSRVSEVAEALGVSREQVEAWVAEARALGQGDGGQGDKETEGQGEDNGEIVEPSVVDEMPSDDEVAPIYTEDEGREEEDVEEEDEPAVDPRAMVRVRVLCDMGLLAGKAVWKGEVHRVMGWQYLAAKRVNPKGYEMVR